MQIRSVVFLLVCACVGTLSFGCAQQAPAPPPAPAAPAAQLGGTLIQVMRGIIYPASNVIFAGSNGNPADVKPAKDPSIATDPLASTYGQWTAVENAGIALAEGANLLTIPGRKCSNGVDAPMSDPNWPKFVQGLRDAGKTVYMAAQAKNADKMLEAADVMTTACSNCHDKWRDKPGGEKDRCM